MSFYDLYLPVITNAEFKRAHKISDRLCDEKRVSKTDKDFHDWYNEESQRIHGLSEGLKQEGWNEFHSDRSLEDRAHGLEKVIYSHWHRAIGAGAGSKESGSMEPHEYAGHWLYAQRDREWFDKEDGQKIFALLCARYPIPRKPLLKDGYSYVWITPERSKARASKRQYPII
jgi:hypothetical protein